MKSGSIFATLALLSSVPVIGQGSPSDDDLMERLSIDQVMRLSTLPPARIAEMHCAGAGQWLVANRPVAAKSPTRRAADRLSVEVKAAIANDAELPADLAGELLASVMVEAGKKAGEEATEFLFRKRTTLTVYCCRTS